AGPGALPLFVIPLYRAGERPGNRALAFTGGVLALGAGVTQLESSARMDAGSVILWGGLALALGILASWEGRISSGGRAEDPIASEATALLGRLAELTASLDGGLDPQAIAERALDELPVLPLQRSAVLAGAAGGGAIPIALRGAGRVPWDEPGESGGALGQAWLEGITATGRDGGRIVVAAPLRDVRGRQIGILVTDFISRGAPTEDDVAAVAAAADHHGPSLAVALAYAALREQAGSDERNHLARTMHDGIAQDIAAFGFHLDLIRFAAAEAGDRTAPDLSGLRAEIARILGDLRADITDLKIGLRPEHGLGAAISARLQQFGSATGTVVTVVLRESGFRLPAAVEIRLFRLCLDVLADAHRHQASTVTAELVVAAPHFDITIRHDGASSLTQAAAAERLGPDTELRVENSSAHGLVVRATPRSSVIPLRPIGHAHVEGALRMPAAFDRDDAQVAVAS
ncbi:MAG: histidine kinase, partial [Candidatus Phosphoribacter sp.]